jgi:MbtH protein
VNVFDDEEGSAGFMVLVNARQRYSLWPADIVIPPGWRDTGVQGSKAACAEYLRRTWTDIRPKA